MNAAPQQPNSPDQPYQMTPEDYRAEQLAKSASNSQRYIQLVTAALAKIYRDIMMMILKR